jgi:hypothetical protein
MPLNQQITVDCTYSWTMHSDQGHVLLRRGQDGGGVGSGGRKVSCAFSPRAGPCKKDREGGMASSGPSLGNSSPREGENLPCGQGQ